MQTDNPDEYYDASIRNRKFGRVDAYNGPVLLEKYVFPPTPPFTQTFGFRVGGEVLGVGALDSVFGFCFGVKWRAEARRKVMKSC